MRSDRRPSSSSYQIRRLSTRSGSACPPPLVAAAARAVRALTRAYLVGRVVSARRREVHLTSPVQSNESGELCCGAAFSPVPPATWMDRPDQPAPTAVRGRPADPDLARPRGRTAPGPGRVRCRSPRRCPVRTERPTSSGPGRTWTTTGDWDPPSTPAARPGHPRRRRNGLPRWWRQRDWGRLNGRLGSREGRGQVADETDTHLEPPLPVHAVPGR